MRLFCWIAVCLVAGCGGEDMQGPVPNDVGMDGVDDPGDSGDTADVTPDTPDTPDGPRVVPLAPDSPWPKFRRDPQQSALSTLSPVDDGADLWVFPTGKGIFSSPVVDAEGTIYIGSADRNFYALNPDGSEKWRFATGEIIDSSGLLDDRGRVYFGSGDGQLYALDAATGDRVWTFAAQDPSETGAFINWFEGNVAMGTDGTLYAPNDNFRIYAVDRDSGEQKFSINMPDQTWSLPAVDAETGRLFIGNNNVIDLLPNTYAFEMGGSKAWSASTKGSIAASPQLLGGTVLMGGFDGILHAYAAADGAPRWTFPTLDHVYASPSLSPSGNVIQASADGSVYSIDPVSGEQVWAFDWGAVIRSSPAVDADGNAYMGTGDGHLLVVNADGTLRWALELIEDDRDDLNASPALGRAIYIAGESGDIFGVPYDYCLRAEQSANARCTLGPAEPLPDAGVSLQFTTRFGTVLQEAPALLDGNQAMAFSLQVREGGDSVLALIDSEALEVTVEPASALIVDVSGNRRFLTVSPVTVYAGDDSGNVTFTLRGTWLRNPERDGLLFTGGEVGGQFEESFTFALRDLGVDELPLPIPQAPGDPSGVVEMLRLAAPLPTLLPSYNQIGFDSLHYVIGFVEGTPDHAVAWLVEGRPTGPNGETQIAPDTRGMFPFEVRWENGLLTFDNRNGLSLEVLSAVIAFQTFRVAATLDANGDSVAPAVVTAVTKCGDIPLYGPFLQMLGLCNPQTDLLSAYGATLIRRHEGGVQEAPSGVGSVTFDVAVDGITANFADSQLLLAEHSIAILLVDTATGAPVRLNYGPRLQRVADEAGRVSTVRMPFLRDNVPDEVRAYVMVGAYPAVVQTVTIPSQ